MKLDEWYFYGRRYNRKRKPWRSARHFRRLAGVKGKRLIPALFGVIVLEGVVLAGRYGLAGAEELPSPFRDVITIQRKRSVATEPDNKYDEEQEETPLWPGETRERGFSIDWKDKTVRFWQKEESYRLEEP